MIAMKSTVKQNAAGLNALYLAGSNDDRSLLSSAYKHVLQGFNLSSAASSMGRTANTWKEFQAVARRGEDAIDEFAGASALLSRLLRSPEGAAHSGAIQKAQSRLRSMALRQAGRLADTAFSAHQALSSEDDY